MKGNKGLLKKAMAFLLTLTLVIGLIPVMSMTAYADGVQYVERSWNGSEVVQTIKTADCTPISNCGEELTSGWYYVNTDKEYGSSDRLYITGTVNLVLMDGKTLTCNDGINVGPDSTLNIFPQVNGTGKLIAKGDTNNCAAIGGEDGQNCGNVTIHGGNITADGYNDNEGEDGAGIGGGDSGSGGHITIYGGVIEATGSNNGAGIGGGTRGSGGTIDIYGGFIKAKGGEDSAGIGGGDKGYSGTISIYGGEEIEATGAKYAAGIGGGDVGNYNTINISGGKIIAKGGDYAAGIGSGDDSGSEGGVIKISGTAYIEATGGIDAAGIGGGEACTGGNITISGGTIKAYGGSNTSADPDTGGAGIGGGDGASSGNITITGGTISEAKGGTHSAGIGGGDGGLWNKIVISGGTVNATGGDYGAGIGGGDKNSSTKSSGEIIITGGTVNANGGGDGAGIGGGEWTTGGTITISGGTIKANGGTMKDDGLTSGTGGAGIGGGDGGAGGDITISGGVIEAKGGEGAAGIGNGESGNGNKTNITLKYSEDTYNISIKSSSYRYNDEDTTVTLKMENDFKDKSSGDLFLAKDYTGNDLNSLKDKTLVRANTHDVKVAEMQNGSITADKTRASKGDTITLTVTPNAGGYELKEDSLKATFGETQLSLTQDSSDASKYTFTMPDGDVEVTAEFKRYDNDPYQPMYQRIDIVYFNGHKWFIIENNSESATTGSLKLLAADNSFGSSAFAASNNTEYLTSTVKAYLDQIIAGTAGEGKPVFSGVADALIMNKEVNSKLYLLKRYEADALLSRWQGFGKQFNRWWLYSKASDNSVYLVVKSAFSERWGTALNHAYSSSDVLGVVPALQLDLSKVVFDSDARTFKLKVPAESISLNKASTTIYVDNSETLVATILPEATDSTSADKTVLWTSSDEGVATVDNTGKVVALASGTATITATATSGTPDAADDQTATCEVTVVKYDSDATAPIATNPTYNGAPQALVNAGSVTGGTMEYALGMDNETAPTEGWSTAIPTDVDAGSYYVWYRVKGDDKHNDAEAVPVNASIVKRSVTLTSASDSKDYDGRALSNSQVNVSGEGFAEGDGASYEVTGSQTLPGSSANVFTYTLSEGTKEDNYNITKVEGTLTIADREAKYEIVPEANSGNAMYDGSEHSVTGIKTDTFQVDGNTYTVSGLTAEGKGTNAGTYEVSFSGTAVVKDSQGNDVTKEFSVRPKSGILTIEKRSITLSSATDSKTYDGGALTNNKVTVTGDGFAQGEGATYKFTGSRTTPGTTENAFTYTLKENTLADNYNISKQTGTLTVNHRDTKYNITLTANSSTFKYDGKNKDLSGFTVDANGDGKPDASSGSGEGGVTFTAENGKNYTLKGMSAEAAAVNAGVYFINVKGTPVILDEEGFDETDEFTISVERGLLTIEKRKVILTSSADSKSYDGKALTNSEVTVGGEGFVEGEGASYTVSGTQTLPGSSENFFTYKLNEGTKANNYDIGTTYGLLTVIKADATKVRNPIGNELTYNGEEQQLALPGETYDGQMQYVLGENENVAPTSGWSTSIPSATKAGTYYVWYKVVGDDNHNDDEPACVIATIAHDFTEVTGTPATCHEDGVAKHWKDENGTLYKDAQGKEEVKEADLVIRATGHDWNEPTYQWAKDNSSVTATRICKNDESHVETETVNSTSEVIKEATETLEGEVSYTAAFTNPAFKAQTKTVITDKKEHVHSLVKTEGKEATCEEDGNIAYWTCSSCGKIFKDSESKEEISIDDTITKATGHNFGDWIVTKPATEIEEGQEIRICKNDPSHTETRIIPSLNHVHRLTKVKAVAATCEKDGNKEYWICDGGESPCKRYFIDGEGIFEINIENLVIKATGHDWNEPTYKWLEDNSSVTATRICKNDSDHVETETVSATSQVTREATETYEGERTFKAAFTNPAFQVQTKTETIEKKEHVHNLVKTEAKEGTCEEDGNIEYWTCSSCGKIFKDAEGKEEIPQEDTIIKATGHDWNEPTYQWAKDNSSVTATRTCKNDPDHVETETASTTSQVTKEATETEEGEKTYTANFTNPAFTPQTATEVIPKLEPADDPTTDPTDDPTVDPTDDPTTDPTDDPTVDPTDDPTTDPPEEIFYSNTEGDGSQWIEGSNTTADFTFNRSKDDEETFSHFTGIQVDGKDVDEADYTAESGSVIIKLKPEYLESLSVGEHTITAKFDDGGYSSAKFTIVKNTSDTEESTPKDTEKKDESKDQTSQGNKPASSNSSKTTAPKTGDTSNILLWIVLISATILSLYRIIRRRFMV